MNAIKGLAEKQLENIKEGITSAAAADNAKIAKEEAVTLGEKIAHHTCDELDKRIPTIISNITSQIIDQLKDRINSETFTTDFINVLQTKLLEDNTYSELFLAKFDTLFDTIIKEAKNRHDKKEFEKEQNTTDTQNPLYRGSGYHKKTRKGGKKTFKKTKKVRFL